MPAPPPPANVNRVAIALFENRTGDVSLDALGELVAERIIRTLGGVSGMRRLCRDQSGWDPVRRARRERLSPDPGASLIVTGTYYAQGDELEFQARLLDGASGRLLHGPAPVTGLRSQPADALHVMEQKVAGAIAIHFDEFFGGLHAVSHPPTLDAYREYRGGLETFHSDYPRALKHLERALEKDPGFLLPLVITYFAHGNRGEFKKQEAVVARMEGEWDRLTPAERLLVEFLRARRERRLAQALRLLQDLERSVPTSFLVNHNLVQQRGHREPPSSGGRRVPTGVVSMNGPFGTASAPFRRVYLLAGAAPAGRVRSRAAARRTGTTACARGTASFSRRRREPLSAWGVWLMCAGAIDQSLSITAGGRPAVHTWRRH